MGYNWYTGLNEGGDKSGKTSVIQRYTANRFSEKETEEPQSGNSEAQKVQLSTHTLKVPGRNEVVSVVFWEIPSRPLPYMKEQYYASTDAALGKHNRIVNSG